MRELRLKMIQMDMDFRKSEETMFAELKREGKVPSLKKNEGILLVSKRRNQFVFITPYTSYESEVNGREVSVLSSQRGRISGGRWDPLMLAEYGRQVGIVITGIKRFEWHFKELMDKAA